MNQFRKAAAFFLVFTTIYLPVSADVTLKDIEQALNKSLEHPYLYFTKADKPAILNRIKSDSNCKDIFRRELAEANRLLYTPVDSKAPPRKTNARFEGSYEYEGFIMKNANAAFTLAFVYQMTGDDKYAEKAFEFADVVCDQPTWTHGAHEFPDIYGRVWPWGANDDHAAFGYSQHTDHFVFRMSAVYDWLYPALSRPQRDRIRGALLEKAILRVRGNYEYHWWATAYRCNWCTVCNSSLGVASIALLTEDPNLTDVIAESWNRIGKTLDEIKSGGWQEGMGYLNYTLSTSLNFANVLKRVTDGRLNLYEHPRFADGVNTLLYGQIIPNKSLHFGDSGGGRIASYNMYTQLMLETGNKQAAWLRKHLNVESPASIYDIFLPESALEPTLPAETSIHFPSVNWVIMRSGFIDPQKVVVAAKSGMNDDPHHGHLDAGHFSIYWRGQEFICDHGSAGYDKAYFDEARWTYPLASTEGHNAVMVNGEKQLPCKLKNKPWNLTYGGKVIEFRPSDSRDYTLLDPTNAYPKKELKNWRRHIILDKPVITVVVDEVSCAKGAEIEARFHSAVTQDIKDDYVLLNSDNGNMAVIPVVQGKYSIRPGSHAIMMAQRNARFRRVPYFGTVTNARKERTVIVTIILPVEDSAEAEGIVKSVKRSDNAGGLSLSFIKDGEKYSYSFRMGADGLVLE
jgi:hypothetical protein